MRRQVYQIPSLPSNPTRRQITPRRSGQSPEPAATIARALGAALLFALSVVLLACAGALGVYAHFARSLPSPNELYERILTRWEHDFDAAIVRQSLCLIWAAHGGLSEVELLYLLGRNNEPLPRVLWMRFYKAVGGDLAFARYGLAFAHLYLSSAVERKYLCTPQDRSSPHKNLARFYVSLGLPTLEGNLKALKYLPFHACEANEDGIWINAMTDFGFLHAVVERVDVTTGTDDNGNRIQWHGGYLIVLDEIQRWLGRRRLPRRYVCKCRLCALKDPHQSR